MTDLIVVFLLIIIIVLLVSFMAPEVLIYGMLLLCIGVVVIWAIASGSAFLNDPWAFCVNFYYNNPPAMMQLQMMQMMETSMNTQVFIVNGTMTHYPHAITQDMRNYAAASGTFFTVAFGAIILWAAKHFFWRSA